MKKITIAMLILEVVMCIIGIIGYGQCVVKFIKCDFEPSYKAEIVYGIGTFSGLGCIVGLKMW